MRRVAHLQRHALLPVVDSFDEGEEGNRFGQLMSGLNLLTQR